MKLQTLIKGSFTTGALALSLAACSPSATQLKKVMQEHPEIIHAAIEADPKGFFETVQKVSGKAREKQMAEQMETEFKRVMEETKTPKKIEIEATRPAIGPEDAKITIVEWADFNCGHCSDAADTIAKVVEEYKNDVRVVFKHLPILAPASLTAAEYMEAIALQDKSKALQFHEILFKNQGKFREGGEKFLKDTAKEVGADLARLQKDRKSDIVKKVLENDKKEASENNFSGTPGFMINGASVHGAYPLEFFKKVIDQILSDKKS